jgi:hypothetical protein
MALPPSWYPGEALVLRLWESVERFGTGLLSPTQIRREGRARADVRRYELLSDAQTGRELEEMTAGRLILDSSGKLIPPPNIDPRAEWRREPPPLLPPVDDTTVFVTAQRREYADAMFRLLNLRKTVVLAEEEMEQTAKNFAATAEEITAVDRDWLYRWKERAERVSVEEMQRLWAQLLAGETRPPGSFSLRTQDLLFSLTKTEAELIAAAARYCIKGYNRDVVIYKHKEYLDANGIGFDRLLYLEDMGFLMGMQSGALQYQYAFEFHGEYGFIPLTYNGKTIVVQKAKDLPSLTLPVYIVTRRRLVPLSQGAPYDV